MATRVVAEMINYEENAVVSKPIVNKPAGTVTLFAFDKGQELSEHVAPFDALAQIVEGSVEITIEGETGRFKGGEMVIMPANVPHSLKAIERMKLLLTMIRV